MAEQVFRLPCGSEQIADQLLDACLYLVSRWNAADRVTVQKTRSQGKSLVEFRGKLAEGEVAQLMDLAAGKIPEGYKSGVGQAQTARKNEADQASASAARYPTTEADKAKARQLFEHGTKQVEKRNYEYAIECYLNGLRLWPDAVGEGHQPLRGCAVARMHTGGKKPGFADGIKYAMMHKDPIKSMLNAEWLYSRDPSHAGYMEGILKNANKAHCDDTVMWIGPILREALEAEKKPHAKRFELLATVYEELGDRCLLRGENVLAIQAFERASEAMAIQKRLSPNDNTLQNKLRDLSTKITIVRGKYQTAESFRESMDGAESQREIHDRDRMVQTRERVDALVESARKEWEANPNVPGKLFTLVTLLCRQEDEEQEKQAIGLLVQEYKRTDNYQYKTRAEDIRRQQLARVVSKAQVAGDAEAVKAARTELLRFELPLFAERIKKYPTDQRIRFEYAVRLFDAGKLDEAIPAFQSARLDPKNRSRCAVYLGRAFFRKGLHQQSLDILAEALTQHEIPDDDLGKDLLYWKARAEEAGGQAREAQSSYGQLLRMDYNYRDVRARLEALKGITDER